MERVPMTKEGYEKKKAELDRMQNVEMLEVARRKKGCCCLAGSRSCSSAIGKATPRPWPQRPWTEDA